MDRTTVQNRKAARVLSGLLVLVLLASSLLTVQANNGPSAATIAAPDLVSPTNGAETTGNPADPITSRLRYQPLGIPTFQWENVGALKYELEVATTPTFGASVILSLNDLQYSMWTPNGNGESTPGFGLIEGPSGDFTDQATFYWRVRAWDDDLKEWSTWSSTWSFVRHWGYQPQLLGPADNSIHSQTPYFEWQPVPGASFYQIQIDTSNSFGSPFNYATDLPRFTRVDTLQNDTDWFWRVRAFHRPNSGSTSGGYGGEWSEAREFQLAWSSGAEFTGQDNRPLQLIPPDNANYVNRPLFCWKPVEGAKEYAIDISYDPSFVAGTIRINDRKTKGTCFVFPRNGSFEMEDYSRWYWRVTAINGNGFRGQRTDDGPGSAAFKFDRAPGLVPTVPTMFYPPYYYPPVMDDTFEDRTVAIPTFMWDHLEGATSYNLRIDDDLAMADPPTVVVTTANASFTFTDTATYPLQDGQIYYWKVRADGSPSWSVMNNKWKTRIDRAQVEVTNTVHLIQPTYQGEPWTGNAKYGQESVTYYPNFAWTAVAPIGNATYRIQIAHDAAFGAGDIVHDAQTEFVEYTPTERPEPGTYFWRVRQVAPTTGAWSDVGRFIVSRNFTPFGPTVDGDPADWVASPESLHAPSGEAGDADAAYDLPGFYIANNELAWYLGMFLPAGAELGIYFDVEHFDQTGADAPPSAEGHDDPNPPVAHQPEYAIYLSSADLTGRVYQWNNSNWTPLGGLVSILATAAYGAGAQFLEIEIPVGSLGQPASMSLMMFTMNGAGAIQDRVPNRPGQPTVAAFLTESTTQTPLLPANSPSDPALARIEHNTPVLTWRHNNSGSGGANFFQTFQDDSLTNLYEGENGNSPIDKWQWDYNTNWAPEVHYSDNNSYHWTIQRGGFDHSAPNHFRKAGYIPTDLQFSPLVVSGTMTYTNRTPGFSWQPAQSAPEYFWELFGGSGYKSKVVKVPYYTPDYAIEDGTYTWKVWSRDAMGRLTAEAAQGEFRKVSDTVPTLPPTVSADSLVLRWQPVDYAAYYRIEIADDAQFSRDRVTRDTWNTTFTPRAVLNAVKDGAFYWRVVTVDNRNNVGPSIDLFVPALVYLPMVVR